MRKSKYILPLLLLLCLGFIDASAQRPRRRQQREFSSQRAEKKVIGPDSLELARRDSLHRADSLFRVDSLSLMEQTSLEQPAFSTARDSVVEDFSDGRRTIHYYGDVKVEYGELSLTAERMDYDMSSGTVHAYGVLDTLTGEWKGQPVMKQGSSQYEMEDLRYNFKTRKARITNMLTNDEEGIIRGKDIKMMPDNSINISHGRYTVCDDEHPHYYLKLLNAKVVTKPGRKIVFGPANLVLEDVNLPIGIPYGFVPNRPERATGLLMPSFGEETARGFYMRDLGMYFVFGDYFDLSVTGDLYSLGSWGIDVNSRYKVNYKFSGNFALTYSDDKTGEQGSPDFSETKNFGLRWSHSQDSKAHPGTSFSASVNFSSPSNSRYNSRSVEEALQNQVSSSISWGHNFNGKANLSLNMLHSQNSRDSSYTFTLPSVNFSVSTFYPFKRKNRVGKERAYEKISFGYSMALQNKINFKASEFMQPGFTDRFRNGMTHNFNIGLPSFTLLRYLNFSPSVSYGQNWFFQKNEYFFNPETNSVESRLSPQFSHFGITQTYSGGISMSTRIYGTFNFGKYRKVQAIRHVISPSISMSLSPEKATYANGYRTLYYRDTTGVEKEYAYNIYSGQLNSPPGRGKSATMSFGIGNNLEAKVRNLADTTGKGTKKVKLIDQLNIRSGYNFLADSLKMSTVSMNMSTTLFNKVNISASANFDPYALDSRGRRYDKFAFMAGQGPLRFTNASVSMSYSISGKGHIDGNDGRSQGGGGARGAANYYQRIYNHPVTGEYIPGGWLYYTNPDVPWSLNFSYSFSCTHNKIYDRTLDALVPNNNITQTLSVSGNIKLTPRMSINASSGFDIQAMKMTTTQLSATYDLHCFTMSLSWVPMGQWQSYNFLLRANASALADLLRLKKSSSYWDN